MRPRPIGFSSAGLSLLSPDDTAVWIYLYLANLFYLVEWRAWLGSNNVAVDGSGEKMVDVHEAALRT